MVLRVIKVVFGLFWIKAAIEEYSNYVKQVGHGNVSILVLLSLLSIIGAVFIYAGIRNVKILDVVRRKA